MAEATAAEPRPSSSAEPGSRAAVFPRCLPSGWCDYSSLHSSVREALEAVITNAVEGKPYSLPVVVAPYGSGKTTILRHLEWYARRKLGVQALIVELREIVDFIVERHGVVHESQLPLVLLDFFRERTGSPSGVLLVDEVEESYDSLRGVVEYETSPLRGLAEAARRGGYGLAVVLAFGPSSAFKEAVFGPVAWRSRVYGIPLLPPSSLASLVESAPERLRSLLANTLWWMGRGRPAWVSLAAQTLLPRIVEALASDPGRVYDVVASEPTASEEIVEGVPLVDRSGLREYASLAGGRGAYLLVFLAGPVPASLLESLGGSAEPGPAVAASRLGVRVEDAAAGAQAVLARIARSRGAGSESVEKAVASLELVLEAWSSGGIVLYDVEGLRQAFRVAADLAREVYLDDPMAAELLDALTPELLPLEPVRLPELHYAAKPAMLSRVYPLITASPLVGCARRAGAKKVLEAVRSLSLEEALVIGERIASETGLGEVLGRAGLRGLVLVDPGAPLDYSDLLCRALKEGPLAVLARASEPLPGPLRVGRILGRLLVVELPDKPWLFAASLAYNESLGVEQCSADRMSAIEARNYSMYSEVLKILLLEALASRSGEGWEGLSRLLSRAEALGVLGRELLRALLRGDAGARELRGWLGRVAEALAVLAGAGVPGAAHAQKVVEEATLLVEEAEAVVEKLTGEKGLTAGLLAQLADCMLGESQPTSTSEPHAALATTVPGAAEALERLGLRSAASLAAEAENALRGLSRVLAEASARHGGLGAGLAELVAPVASEALTLLERIRSIAGEAAELNAAPQGLGAKTLEGGLAELLRVLERAVDEARSAALLRRRVKALEERYRGRLARAITVLEELVGGVGC